MSNVDPTKHKPLKLDTKNKRYDGYHDIVKQVVTVSDGGLIFQAPCKLCNCLEC